MVIQGEWSAGPPLWVLVGEGQPSVPRPQCARTVDKSRRSLTGPKSATPLCGRTASSAQEGATTLNMAVPASMLSTVIWYDPTVAVDPVLIVTGTSAAAAKVTAVSAILVIETYGPGVQVNENIPSLIVTVPRPVVESSPALTVPMQSRD